MKFLIVDDLKEIVELVEFYLQTFYPQIQIVKAFDGQEATAIISKDPQIAMVISDLKMPKKDGADVYKALRELNQDTPFILLSTTSIKDVAALKDAKYLYHLPKPFSTDELLAVVKKALSETQQPLNHIEIPSFFIAVEANLLYKLGTLGEDIYLKLSDNRFVKVLHAGSIFNDYELKRFQKKETHTLWVQAKDFNNLFEHYKKQIYFRDRLQSLDSLRLSEDLAIDHSMANAMARNFGWSPEIINITIKTVESVLKLIENTKDLNSLLDTYRKNNKSKLSTHALELSMFSVAIINELEWGSKLAKEKAVFSSILHDMELNNELFETKISMVTNLGGKAFLNPKTEEFRQIRDHGAKMATTIRSWSNCPSDIDAIILQHHERPDGFGFPNGLTALEIAPIAAVLILAEDVLFNSRQEGKATPAEYLLSKKEFYSRGEFKNVFAAALKSLGRSAV